jgi:hypothetical protein
MDTKSSIDRERVSNREDPACAETERASVSPEEFQTWLDEFRDRYADALDYLRDH